MMMGREEEEAFVDEEESSQCSSGCQSGWTLYLEHSGSGQQQQPCTLSHHPVDVRVRRQMSPHSEYSSDEEDSMVSDASSGPAHDLRDDEEELLHVQGQINKQRRPSFAGDRCYADSGIAGGGRSASVSAGSRSSVSTRSGRLGEAGSRKKRRTIVVQRADEAAIRCRGVVDDGDLDDTASSSAFVASADVVEAMHRKQQSCAFMAEHCSSLDLEWPAV
jgi:hypothetical protein